MNQIGDAGAAALGKALAKSKTLSTLTLESNDIGDDGAVGLGRGLAQNNSLNILKLYRNEIGDEGAIELGKGLAKNNSLTDLNLSVNAIGDLGAAGLGEGLGKNKSLTSLELEFNEIGYEGAVALGRGVGKHSSLLEFSYVDCPQGFGFNKMSPPGIAAVAELLLLHKNSLATVGTNAHIFATFVLVLDKEDPEMHSLFADHELWLQVGVSDAYEGTMFADEENKLPLVHALFDCHQTTTHFSLQQRFCEEIIAKRLLLRDGLLMMEAEDSGGRSVRSLALTNQNTKEWAKTYGTYLDRYSVAKGPPVHESKTCAVHYATDIQTNKAVALKIMRDKEQYAREISARDISSEGGASLAGCLPLLHREDPDFAARLDDEQCLVMPQGSRSLFEAINTERFAGRDLQKVRTIAYKIALAIQDLHNSGRIHGDIKPRNAVRVVPSKQHTFSYDETGGRVQVPDAWRQNVTGEQLNGPPDEEWQLIDLDASARILNTQRVTEKVSTGYAAPELAQWHFLHQARADKAPTVSAALDVWGFGVVLYQMLSGTKLFMVDESDDNLVHGRDKTELMNWLALDDERLERIKERETNGMGKGDGLRPDGADAIEAARDLVRLCLRGDPTERITMTQIIEDHPFFDFMRPQNSCRPDNDEDVATSGAGRDEHRKKKMRFSRRVLSLHKLVVPRRFSLFGRTTSPRLSRDDHTGDFYADHGHNELTELSTYHFFLSHMQKQAAGIVKNLAFGLERYQMSAWTEMRAAEVTLASLQRGVLSSQRFVLVLTRDALFRPFCLAGLKFAIDYFSSMPGGLQEHIIFIVEEDQRFSPWHTGIDEPWYAVDWEEGNVDLDDEIASAGDFLRSCQTQYNSEQTSSRRKQLDEATAKARSLRRTRDTRQLRETLENLNFDPDEVFGLAEDALSLCKRIPYRRRLFEEGAMLRALADHAGFQSDSEIAIELVAKLNMNATASVLASLFQDAIHEGSSVVIVVLEQDCLGDVHDALTSERLSGLPLLAVADESTFNAADAEHVGTCSQEVQSRLFDHLELLAWRTDAEVRDGVYMVGHEQPALIDELCSRAAKLRRSQL
ncbi:Protein kinase, putative [Hondaea fermentalgiana]|uniref:Protein kinase, putative n=1 Tax=Hondaea fermentalgiana TaxID=2315210 RepID=A0A2R5GRJ3_9STRA|nr:Protein kinase, putative [Hondaea fermentalgiana]|eukprot:GBG30504.1 Protein kinase, putative [Hondaea fermentalgiana]